MRTGLSRELVEQGHDPVLGFLCPLPVLNLRLDAMAMERGYNLPR